MPDAPQKTIETSELAREYAALKGDRSLVEQQWDQISRYFDPIGSGDNPQTLKGEGNTEWQRPAEPWDSTAIDAADKLAASIHGWVTSPAAKWFDLKWRAKELAEDPESAQWLSDAGYQVFLTLADSDFHTEIASADGDLVRYSNMFMVAEAASPDEWKGMDFEAPQVRDGYFREDSRGKLDRWYRRLYWTPVQLRDLCLKHGWDVPQEIEAKCSQPDQNALRREYVFCVFKRYGAEKKLEHTYERNRMLRKARKARAAYEQRMQMRPGALPEADAPPEVTAQDETTYPLAPHLRPVGGVYFEASTGEVLGQECGYYEFPVVFVRWAKSAGSKWGHGPANTMLATVKTLNAIVEAKYEALARMVNPPVAVKERGLIGDLHLEPGGVTAMRDPKDLIPIDTHAKISETTAQEDVLRNQIRDAFYNHDLAIKESPAMTLGEVQIRYELMNRKMGATLARIECDGLSPLVKIVLGHLFRANQLGKPPAKVAEAYANKPPDFDVEYLGPLARSQRTDEVGSIERGMAFAQALLKDQIPEFTTAVTASLDIPKAIRRHFTLLGVPPDLLKPEEDVQKQLDAVAKQRDAAMKAEQAKAEGEAADAHASAAAKMAQAQASAAPLPPGQPVPASPVLPVSPAMPV